MKFMNLIFVLSECGISFKSWIPSDFLYILLSRNDPKLSSNMIERREGEPCLKMVGIYWSASMVPVVTKCDFRVLGKTFDQITLKENLVPCIWYILTMHGFDALILGGYHLWYNGIWYIGNQRHLLKQVWKKG